MIRVIVVILIFLIHGFANGQPKEFIDSLRTNHENQIIEFKTNCTGCIVLNQPCREYVQNGNPWNLYIIWKNSAGYHIKKVNNCGSSEILTLKKWRNNPFEIIDEKSSEIDTTKLRYPLSSNSKDALWSAAEINHYEYYEFAFPTYSIRDLVIKDYAFREPTPYDEVLAGNNPDFKMNQHRYEYNNSTAIKELIDCIMLTLNRKSKKLSIISVNKQD
ncbi:MAG: hypothetical protein IPH20_24535 [Bacteroidales bacterium]|nr:hypothetical protein [Bacteroidales bacterium]